MKEIREHAPPAALRNCNPESPPRESMCADLEPCFADASCTFRHRCEDNHLTAEPVLFHADRVEPRFGNPSTGKIDFQEAVDSSCGDFNFLVNHIL
jgi:hypothetical protein